MRGYLVTTVLIVGSLTLAACGESPGCRALTGGAMGAAGGAALGAIGGNPALGAVAGGATGAAVGGLTSPDAVSAGPSPVCD
jgi:osmotically inducible lipoprotein OsmB